MVITEMGSLNVKLRTFCTCVMGWKKKGPIIEEKVAKNIRKFLE